MLVNSAIDCNVILLRLTLPAVIRYSQLSEDDLDDIRSKGDFSVVNDVIKRPDHLQIQDASRLFIPTLGLTAATHLAGD